MSTVSERAHATIAAMPVRDIPLSEQFRLVALQWVDAQAASDILDETKSSVFAEKCLELGDIPVSKAEMRVRGSKDWRDHLDKIVAAKRATNKLKMQLKYIEMRHREWISANATNREEMRMGR